MYKATTWLLIKSNIGVYLSIPSVFQLIFIAGYLLSSSSGVGEDTEIHKKHSPMHKDKRWCGTTNVIETTERYRELEKHIQRYLTYSAQEKLVRGITCWMNPNKEQWKDVKWEDLEAHQEENNTVKLLCKRENSTSQDCGEPNQSVQYFPQEH